VRLLLRTGSPGQYGLRVGELHRRPDLAPAQARRTEPADTRPLGDSVDLARVFERAGERFVDEHRQLLPGGRDFPKLRQMFAAVDALEQDRVHFPDQRLDVRHDLDAPLLGQFLGVIVDPSGGTGDIRAAALEGRHNLRSRDVVRAGRIVQHLAEGRNVRRISADNS
jgi:hypothetical protein